MFESPLSDEDWQRIAHLFGNDAPPGVGRPRRDPREIVNAILWIVLNDEKWQYLPSSFPPSQTCYIKWLEWRRSGTMSKVFAELGISRQLAR
jgi:transposase